jgi:hypothetical protein
VAKVKLPDLGLPVGSQNQWYEETYTGCSYVLFPEAILCHRTESYLFESASEKTSSNLVKNLGSLVNNGGMNLA